MNDRGSVSILFAGLALLLVIVGVGAARVSHALVLRQAAQVAADSAALAAARDPALADRYAAANGARVVSLIEGEGWVQVEVDRRGARAQARAALALPEPAGGRGQVHGLDPRLAAALARAERIIGRPIVIVSGVRSYAEQQWLWERRHANPFPVAVPGTSKHERGLAVDVSLADAALVESLRVGLCRPYADDPVHLELC